MLIFKIENNLLQVKDQYVGIYAYLRCMSKNGICNASRKKIAETFQIKRIPTISEYTNALEEKLFIKKKQFFTKDKKELVEYRFREINENFLIATSDLFTYNLKAEEVGLLIKVASIREKWSNKVLWSKAAMIEEFNCSKVTFNKRFNKLIEVGIIKESKDGFIVSENVIQVVKPTIKLSEDRQILLNDIIDNKDKHSQKLYNQAKNYIDKQLYYHKDANKYFDNLMAGLVNIKNELKEIDYNILTF